jgi:hypothetical protein
VLAGMFVVCCDIPAVTWETEAVGRECPWSDPEPTGRCLGVPDGWEVCCKRSDGDCIDSVIPTVIIDRRR